MKLLSAMITITATMMLVNTNADAARTTPPVVATDDLGRALTMPTTDTSRTLRTVGLFYFLWLGEHGETGPHDNTRITTEHPEAIHDANHPAWGPMGAQHFWGEPLYGYYYSSDEWVMRKHIEELTNANIDFLYIDVTNTFIYENNAKKLMQIMHEFNEQGFRAPQIVFYTNTASGQVAQQLYDKIYANKYCPDTWYCIDGKPLIIAYLDQMTPALREFFAVREPQWPNEASRDNAWPWMDFTRPQRVFKDSKGNPEVVNVSVAQHAGTVRFCDSAFYGDRTNRGRSWHNGAPGVSENAYQFGYNVQEQWDRAMAVNVPYVLVTGWNEWVAGRMKLDEDKPISFVDCASTEYSRDIEPARGKYFDNYYIQLIANVRKYKGITPLTTDTQNITIDPTNANWTQQWQKVTTTFHDYRGDTTPRNAKAFGTTLTNNTGRNDITLAKVAHDDNNIYFYAETAATLTTPTAHNPLSSAGAGGDPKKQGTWMQVLVNTDNKQTGWYGYDYIINKEWQQPGTTTLAKAMKDGKEYSFENVAQIPCATNGNKIMVVVPRRALGINSDNISLQFKWIDSTTNINTIEQLYIDGDAAPIGRPDFPYVAGSNHK